MISSSTHYGSGGFTLYGPDGEVEITPLTSKVSCGSSSESVVDINDKLLGYIDCLNSEHSELLKGSTMLESDPYLVLDLLMDWFNRQIPGEFVLYFNHQVNIGTLEFMPISEIDEAELNEIEELSRNGS